MTPFDQTLSTIAMSLISDMVLVFTAKYTNHSPYKEFDEVMLCLYEKLDNTGFFSELEIFHVDGDKLTNIHHGREDKTSATVFHSSLFNNALIQNSSSVFSLGNSTVFVTYIHNITTPVYLIYANKKTNIQNHLITTMMNSIVALLNNLYPKFQSISA